MQSTILVPRLAAAAFAIGVGVAIGGACATASADTGSADSSSSASSSASANKGPSRAAVKSHTAATTPTVKSANKTGTARAARVTPAPSAAAVDTDTTPTASSAAVNGLHLPTSLVMGLDELAGNVAKMLGYAPNTGNVLGAAPVLPVRALVLDALAAVRNRMPAAAEGMPTLHPKELFQFNTGEVLGDLLPTDPNGDKLTYTVIQGPTNGTLTVNANGTYYYKPTNDFAETGGIDTAVVVADDGNQHQVVVPINIKVAPTLGVTERFWFRNYTLAPLMFNGYAGTTGDLDGGPAVGTIMLPGSEASWDVTWYVFSSGSVTTRFGTVGFGYTPSDNGYIPAGYQGTDFQVAFKTNSRDTQCASGGGGQCSVPNDKMAIALDKNSPTITLGAADAAKIAAVLPGICYDGSQANCSFIAKSQTAGYSPVRTVGTPVRNETATPTTTSVALADQISQSDTVGVDVKMSGGGLAKLASIINLEITAKYSHTWTKTSTFTQTINVPVGAGREAWIEGSVPVWNVTGDFTIKIGNSTYQLNGATFATPNENLKGVYVIKDKPIASVPATKE